MGLGVDSPSCVSCPLPSRRTAPGRRVRVVWSGSTGIRSGVSRSGAVGSRSYVDPSTFSFSNATTTPQPLVGQVTRSVSSTGLCTRSPLGWWSVSSLCHLSTTHRGPGPDVGVSCRLLCLRFPSRPDETFRPQNSRSNMSGRPVWTQVCVSGCLCWNVPRCTNTL